MTSPDMKPDSFHLAAGDGDEDFRQGRASSDAAPQVTPWFPSSVKPARRGVYEVQSQRDRRGDLLYCSGFAMWTGDEWGMSRESIQVATLHPGVHSAEQNKVWRGLAKAHDASGSPASQGQSQVNKETP